MLRLILSRLGLILLMVLGWGWTAVRLTLDWVGRSTVLDDYNQLLERMPALAAWFVLTCPWWVPAIMAAAATTVLIWSTVAQTLSIMSEAQRKQAKEERRCRELKAEALADPNFIESLAQEKDRVVQQISALIAEIDSVAERWKVNKIPFDEANAQMSEIIKRGSEARKNNFDKLIDQAIVFSPYGQEHLWGKKHAANAGNFTMDGSYLSFEHCSARATLTDHILYFQTTIDEAVSEYKKQQGTLISELFRAKRKRTSV